MSQIKTQKQSYTVADDDNFDWLAEDVKLQFDKVPLNELIPLGNDSFYTTILAEASNRAKTLLCKTRQELEALLKAGKPRTMSDVQGYWLAIRQLCTDAGLTRKTDLSLNEYIQMFLDFRFSVKRGYNS